MKQTILAAFIFFAVSAIAQTVPQKLNYQAVARNASGTILANQVIAVKADILDADQTTSLYSETHNVITNQFGLFTLQVGGGSVVSGNFSTINWGNGNKFIRTSADLTGSTNYQLMGVSQLLSVPYALYAGSIANNGGKNTILLSDTITNAQAQTKIASEYGINTEHIKIIGCTNLTSVDFSMVGKITDVNVENNSVLQSVNFSNLKTCEGDFRISICPLLTTLNLNSLERLISDEHGEGLSIRYTKLSSLNLPSLKRVITAFSVAYNDSMINISVPVLSSVGKFLIISNNLITNLSFPNLTSIDYIGDYSSYSSIYSCSNLASITFNSLTSFKNNAFYFDFNKLPSTQINYLLGKFVSITPNLTGRSFVFSNQTPKALPTGQGITDKATLISRGNTVTTD